MTHPVTPDPGQSALETVREEDDIESELFASAREAGVACFLVTGPELDADDRD